MKARQHLLILLAFSLISGNLIGKSNWEPGVVYLQNKEALKGKIFFNQQLDLVQCEVDGKIKTFAPNQVRLFQFYDQDLAANRVYTPVDENYPYYRRLSFYEVLVTGEITLLRKERYAVKELQPEFDSHLGREAFIQKSAKEPVRVFDYFIFYDNRIDKIRNFENETMTLMFDQIEAVKKFIKSEKLNTEKVNDQIIVLEYYNKLKGNLSLRLMDKNAEAPVIVYQ